MTRSEEAPQLTVVELEVVPEKDIAEPVDGAVTSGEAVGVALSDKPVEVLEEVSRVLTVKVYSVPLVNPVIVAVCVTLLTTSGCAVLPPVGVHVITISSKSPSVGSVHVNEIWPSPAAAFSPVTSPGGVTSSPEVGVSFVVTPAEILLVVSRDRTVKVYSVPLVKLDIAAVATPFVTSSGCAGLPPVGVQVILTLEKSASAGSVHVKVTDESPAEPPSDETLSGAVVSWTGGGAGGSGVAGLGQLVNKARPRMAPNKTLPK